MWNPPGCFGQGLLGDVGGLLDFGFVEEGGGEPDPVHDPEPARPCAD
ncbi:hypothetical protein [Streptomyces sp. NBC_00724]|nr:hypothetical protein OHB17_42585 [Streptomyces sp. NBC_00724]